LDLIAVDLMPEMGLYAATIKQQQQLITSGSSSSRAILFKGVRCHALCFRDDLPEAPSPRHPDVWMRARPQKTIHKNLQHIITNTNH
jgi:hypothetical protein